MITTGDWLLDVWEVVYRHGTDSLAGPNLGYDDAIPRPSLALHPCAHGPRFSVTRFLCSDQSPLQMDCGSKSFASNVSTRRLWRLRMMFHAAACLARTRG